MVPDLEVKPNTVVEISAAKQNNGSVPEFPLSKLMLCCNLDDKPSHMEVLSDGKANVNNEIGTVEVAMTKCTKSGDHVPAEAEADMTENSSSFSGTISRTENASTWSDVEVESPFFGGNGLASMVDGDSGAVPIRKKKLTDHWRRFIRPIMWRCKWIELQIKEMRSQALKYDTELAQYDQRNQVELENSMLEGLDAISQSFSSHVRGSEVMKRKKRKRVEETDVASYMSQHNLFSYYEDEYKRSIADGAFMEDDNVNIDNKIFNGTNGFESSDGWLSLEFKDGDDSLEMLSKIEVAQSQVRKLKDRIDKVMSENPGKYTSINRLSLLVPCNGSTSSVQNMAFPSESGDGMPERSQCVSPPRLSEYNRGDIFMPESAVSNHGEVTPFPDMSESTGQPQVGDSCETNKEAILTDNEPSDEELQNFERVISQFTARHHESLELLNTSPPAVTPEAILPANRPRRHVQPSTSKSNLRNNRKKWGRQKSRLGSWSRRS